MDDVTNMINSIKASYDNVVAENVRLNRKVDALMNEDAILDNAIASYIVDVTKNNKTVDSMLQNQRFGVIDPGYKEMVSSVLSRDIIYIVNADGIIAYGTASGLLLRLDIDDEKDAECGMSLQHFNILTVPMSTNRLKEILGKEILKPQPIFKITYGNSAKILKEINRRNI